VRPDSVETAAWWARPRGPAAGQWIANYQTSLTARHRTLLVDLVKRFQPATLLEVGSHCGPNLIRLCEEMPDLSCSGVDASGEAIEAGRHWAFTKGLSERLELQCGTFPAVTSGVKSGEVDLVISCYALAYVSPSDLGDALYEVGRLATKGAVLLEPIPAGPGDVNERGWNASGYREWIHDYQDAMRWVGSMRGWACEIVPVHPPVDRLNAAMVLTRCS